jgi:tripartite-type tricarboxylate transporter receptor subunit TctC
MRRSAAIVVWALTITCAGLLAWPDNAGAQSYPSRPIHLVTGNPPGGATDFIARIIGQPLSVRLGQSIVIDNRPGANGNISAEVVAKSAPDGYTLLYANDSLVVVNPHIYRTIGVNVMQDMVPVVTTISNQLVLAVNPQTVPVKDFPAFIEFARKPPTTLFYASIGNGSHHHLAMEILKQRAGIDLTHVPYKGGGPASIAVIAGENALMFGGTSVLNHIKNRKLKGLAVTGSKSWSSMPELPTIGQFYPGYKSALWHGIYAPRGTPQPIVDKLRAELNAVLAMPDVKERLVSGGAGEPYVTTPEEFAAVMRADYERYGAVIKSIGFKVD